MLRLVLPVSNADSEITFSMVKKFSEFRTDLSVDTITSLLTTKQNQIDTYVDYEPTDSVLKLVKVPLWFILITEYVSSVTAWERESIVTCHFDLSNNVHYN